MDRRTLLVASGPLVHREPTTSQRQCTCCDSAPVVYLCAIVVSGSG